ncbi:unnamed protein product [Meloidogyne enterolobii]|uniref:Uncharacterized protein n=1 Tax=Meloidogyne enterolobii TaxID=390850 RepID=A0ACB1AUW9_MELEN
MRYFTKPNIILGKVYDPALRRSNFYGYKLGCGDCISMRNKNIPCMACTSNACNRRILLTDESIMCWDGDNVLTCPREITGRACHYAVIKETIVKQGCGRPDLSKEKETDIQLLLCIHDNFCNTKEEFERVLFCLIKGWDELEPKRKMCYENVGMTDSHREPCFINRREDGKVKQGCGEWNKACPDNKDTEFCKYCRTKNCNDEKIIPKYCWTNYGKIKVNGDVPCFVERTRNHQSN